MFSRLSRPISRLVSSSLNRFATSSARSFTSASASPSVSSLRSRLLPLTVGFSAGVAIVLSLPETKSEAKTQQVEVEPAHGNSNTL